MIRTHIIPCDLPRDQADALNRASGLIYTGIVVSHWRVMRGKGHWLSEKSGTRWSDDRTDAEMHSHSIDAAQQGFYKACVTTRALKKAGIEARFPHRIKKFRTTIWKNTAIRVKSGTLVLSNGLRNPKITIPIPDRLRDTLKFVEVRLVYDKKARRYTWHIVAENGKQPKDAPGNNVVSVDLGEIHPAVVGDENSATIVSCRERRSQSQGHAKRLASLRSAIDTKKKGSRRCRRLIQSKVRMIAKYARVTKDLEHKISKAIVEVAAERKASVIAIGDVRDIADKIDKGKIHNGRTSRWNHGKVRAFVTYKAAAEGIKVELVKEHYSSQTCPSCQHRHKPRGRNYSCPSCKFQSHRDVVGQINLLSRYLKGDVGLLPAPTEIKYRMPHNLREMRRCRDTGQAAMSVAR